MIETPGVVIVGGGPAGLATARAYREAGGTEQVTLLTAEPHAPYSRPPLTKEFLRGDAAIDELPIEAPRWFRENDVDLRTGVVVTAVDPPQRRLSLEDGQELAFRACVLATGAEPRRLDVPGGDAPGVLTVRRLEDSLALQRHGPRVAVVGSGFIGCEAAATLAQRGAAVTVIADEEVPQAARLGPEAGARIASWMEEAGVELLAGSQLQAIDRADAGWRLLAGDQTLLTADTVVMATGIEPRLDLARAAGLRIEAGAVATDASMRTSAEDVLAVGDVAFAHNAAVGRPLRVEHWGEALGHGAVAGAVLAGEAGEWDNAPGFWSTIADHTLKHVAWGDGFASVRLDSGEDGGFTAWYADEAGTCVGVLCHDRDGDYERGRTIVESGGPVP